MRISATLAQWINLLAGITQIVLGTFFWSGRGLSLLVLHMAIGMVFVLALWTLAGLARWAGVAWRWVLLTAAWGIVIPAFGALHPNLLPGSLHWLVRLAHLIIGITAMAMAVMLRRAITHRRVDMRAPTGTVRSSA